MIPKDSVSAGISRGGQISPLNKGQQVIQTTMNSNVLLCVKEN